MPLGDLSTKDKARLTAAKNQIPELEKAIAKAKRAGLDVSGLEDTLRSLKAQASKMHQVYVEET